MIGDTKPCGRVTIEPDWTLKTTDPVYDGSVRGPFRYWQDSANDQVEVEIPNIKSIQIERSTSQDIATCNIAMYNQWHYSNSAATGVIVPELTNQLGRPGYFWPKRGESAEAQALWNQEPGQGATLKDGTYDPDFDWTNVIVPNALIRTYQGYGGNDVSVQQAIDDENIMITGAWLIDSISTGTDGMLTIQCRDVGRLLLEQITYPPLVPQSLYPIEYKSPGVSAFDSPFGPDPKGSFNASFGEVRAIYKDSATDDIFGSYDYSIFGHKGSHASDGNRNTYALSPAKAQPTGNNGYGYFWWEFDVEKTGGSGRRIQGMSFTPWAGGYTAYISIKYNGSWFGTETVPDYGGSIPYVKKIQIPLMPPDGNEREISVDFGVANPAENEISVLRDFGSYWYKADQIRITFGDPLTYSGMADGSGNNYRCGIRDIVFRAVGNKTSEYSVPFTELPWTYAMESHPVRGYWVCESNGYVHGFGDAADFDSTAFGPVNFVSPPYASGVNGIHYVRGLGGTYLKPGATSMAAHPSGEGYWVLDPSGRVYAFGEANHYGHYIVPWRGEQFALVGVAAMNMAVTYTGNGYWVVYSDGSVRGFGDASPSFAQTPYTSVTASMINSGKTYKYLFGKPYGTGFGQSPAGFDVGQQPSTAYNWARRGTAIAAHPKKMGFWVTDGSGQVWAFGNVQNYGGLVNRIYNKNSADSFSVDYGNWCHGMTSTKSGDGYWIAFADGHIAAFGDAVKQGTSYVYQNNPQIDLKIPEDKVNDWSFFRYLVWDLARDPDGKGFWVLVANGSVLSYDARFWGQPGWWGKTGYRWKQGNFKEYIDIIKDMLCWSGFTYYDSNIETIKSWATKTLASGSYEQVDDYTLIMQTDGNLVLGTGNFITVGGTTTLQNVVWESETDGNSGAYAVMQSDGNFVVYSAAGSALFNTKTYTRSNARLVLRYDGFFGVQTDTGADLWVGYPGSPDANDRPSIFGNIESTGIFTDKDITGDKFDKRTIIDCINEIKQVVGYNFFIDQQGGARFESPNWWSAGNFDSYGDGQKIYVTYDEEGNYTRVSSSTPGAEPFIPEINETTTLKQYQVSIGGDSLRSEIIIGSDQPDPNNPRATSYVRFVPGSANDEIRPGVPALRNIIRPAIWIDNTFTDKEEQKLMAELINLQIWFSQRAGSLTCVANPNIEINDQIRIIERNTSETYIHYVRGVSSTMDLDTGQYEMSLTTNWLGDENDWVITSDNVYNPISHVSISERVDRWQQITNRELQFSGLGVEPITLTGGFN